MQTLLVTEELRRRGHICNVLKINESRQVKSPDYIDVQNGLDYLLKVFRRALAGCRINVHVNGQSRKGYFLALAAMVIARLTLRPALLTFHGGLSQQYFPRHDSRHLFWAFRLLFQISDGIACDSDEIKCAIAEYGVSQQRVVVVPTFSSQYLEVEDGKPPAEAETFLCAHRPIFFSYVSFRPEYRLEVVRQCMTKFRQHYPEAGFIWLGFPHREMPRAEEFVRDWPAAERRSLLLLGNLTHADFLALMSRCTACLRTPACDGVSASVKEALALRVPVIASENGRRPAGVITYDEFDADDMCAKLAFVVENRDLVLAAIRPEPGADNVGLMADWLAGETVVSARAEAVQVR